MAELTYKPTWTRFLHLSVAIDVYNRKVVGWDLGERMTSDLVIQALNMELMTRKPESVSLHSAQYTRISFAICARNWGYAYPWERWAMLMTTPWPRASLSAWSAS